MSTEFDTAVLIGRFQPFHAGHAALLEQAFAVGSRVVVVLGSAHAARTARNPFTTSEREAMIRASLADPDDARLAVVGQRDVWDAIRWASEVRSSVERTSPGRTALVGHHKDSSSAYLDSFLGWTKIEPGRLGPHDATPLRDLILSDLPSEQILSRLSGTLPVGTLEWLENWIRGPSRHELSQDLQALLAYRKKHGPGPFVTVDAVVRALGHVLLITRGNRPGIGLSALPGGFLEPDEAIESGARRELAEETGLFLAYAPVREVVFSHPSRSERARIITHAFLYEPELTVLPPVTGMDDAGSARWVPESGIAGLEDSFFEDHFHILDVFFDLVSRTRS